MRVGMGVKVSIDALASRSVEGKVKKVFPVASSTARSFTARISLPNPEKVLRPQMFARGQIVLETHANVVVVPRDAILDLTENSGRVFVANGGVAEERKVKVGLSTVYQAEIASGVSAGDAIVTIGQTQLQDKDKIQLKN